MSRTWILTGSPENHAATRAHEGAAVGFRERNPQPGALVVGCSVDVEVEVEVGVSV